MNDADVPSAEATTIENTLLAGEGAFTGDRSAIEAERAKRRRRLNIFTIPATRLIGSTMLLVVIVIHNQLVLPAPGWATVLRYAAALELYCFATWFILWRWSERVQVIDLGLLLMWLDVGAWTAGIYASGGQHSWLFFFALMRVSDQSFLSFRRTVWFAHLAPISYLLMIAYIVAVDHEHVYWPPEIAKAFIIYMCSLYTLLIAWNSKLLRDRTKSAMAVARSSIGELRDKTRQLNDAKEQAESANVAKSNFLANMSHELRTPLNAIIGYAEMLMEDATDNGETQFTTDLEKIRGSGRHLLGLINDVLDVSKIEAGRMEITVQEFSIDDLLLDVMSTATPLARRGGNELQFASPTPLGTMFGDVTRTRQILLNLLSNAAKFTEKGIITVQATRTGDPARAFLTIAVRDTGIGMTPDQLGKLFQPFTQVDASSTRRHEGTGIGLTITKRFAEMLGGSIMVESEAGRGTCFTLRLPVGREGTFRSRTTGAVRVMDLLPVHSDLAAPAPPLAAETT
ncbi:MAG: HAMP domain-containing sensor histidine kinase [bacterium]